jgi:large subunit ribosomal protein L38e
MHYRTQPKEIRDIRDFLKKARRKDAKGVKIKKSAQMTKFKIRCSKVRLPDVLVYMR